MITVDKIKENVYPEIINSINECVSDRDINTLNKWLIGCKIEIEHRKGLGIDTHSLYCELYYLQMVLGLPQDPNF